MFHFLLFLQVSQSKLSFIAAAEATPVLNALSLSQKEDVGSIIIGPEGGQFSLSLTHTSHLLCPKNNVHNFPILPKSDDAFSGTIVFTEMHKMSFLFYFLYNQQDIRKHR